MFLSFFSYNGEEGSSQCSSQAWCNQVLPKAIKAFKAFSQCSSQAWCNQVLPKASVKCQTFFGTNLMLIPRTY